jgi:hypothetical protein
LAPRTPPERSPPASRDDEDATAKRGPDPCRQLFAPPRTYAPPAFIAGGNGCDLIPLTAAESRRLFNLHVHVTMSQAFRQR